MSAASYGIPINFGMSHKYSDSGTSSFFMNAAPDIYALQFSSPAEFSSYEEMVGFSESTPPYNGYGAILSGRDENGNTVKNQYVWNKYEWTKVGLPTTNEFVTIFTMIKKNLDDNRTEWFADFFMRFHSRNIQSNISLLSILERKYIIGREDAALFCGTSGNYGCELNSDSFLENMLKINISGGVNCAMLRLCNRYSANSIIFGDLVSSLTKAVCAVVRSTSFDFMQIMADFSSVDVSAYVNYIGACVASFHHVLSLKFASLVPASKLNPMEKLMQVDAPLYNKINSSPILSGMTDALLEKIDSILYDENDTAIGLFRVLLDVCEYFRESNSVIFDYDSSRNTFLRDLCESLGGVVSLAIFFSLFSNGDSTTRTTYFLHMLNAEAWRDIF